MASKPSYHSHYSNETLSLIERCIADLKLTKLQKKTILCDLKKGKPIPDLVESSKIQTARLIRNKKVAPVPLKRAKKRKIETIIRCGAYDVPVYVPDKNLVDREKEKQRLQDIFYGLDQIPEEEIKYTGKTNRVEPHKFSERHFVYERMKELMKEIEERIQFLGSMEELGLKKKYNFDLSNEITQKLKQLERLYKNVEKSK